MWCREDEVKEKWRKLHNEELHDFKFRPVFYYPGNQIKEDEISGPISRMVDKRIAHRFLVRKPEEQKPLERPRGREGNKNRIGLNEMEEGNVDWNFLDQNRGIKRAVSNVLMKCQVT